MYMSATWLQVTNQFFASLGRFREHPLFGGWQWLESEVRTASGGFLFGRASDVGGNIEGIHDQRGSPAGLLIDEAKNDPGRDSGYAVAVSCNVPAVCEFDRACERWILPDLHGQGAFMEDVPGAVERVLARQ